MGSNDRDDDAEGTYYQLLGRGDGWGIEVTEDEHDAALGRMQAYLDEHEPDGVTAFVRSVRQGEIAALYRMEHNGNLQILGHSIPEPEIVSALYESAWQHALETWQPEEATADARE